MRRLTALLLCLLLPCCALAEGFDYSPLRAAGYVSFVEEKGVDTVWRAPDQPFPGTVDEADSEVAAFIDFVELAQSGKTCLRLTLSLTSPDMLGGAELTLLCGKTAWQFSVFPAYSEYDTTYFEDFSVVLTDESLPLLRDLSRSRGETVSFTLAGEARTLTGTLALSGAQSGELYDLYDRCGGLDQDLSDLRESWPVTTEKIS